MKKIIILFLALALLLPVTVFASNNDLSNRLKGRILLQVEENGEAWYVNPADLERYYLGRPADAFSIMRELGLGVSEVDFGKWNNVAPARLAGRIILRVQSHGEAYYIDPTEFKLHYLGRPADAFALMRQLGLGISNANLKMIKAREGYGDGSGLPEIPELPTMPPQDSEPDPVAEEPIDEAIEEIPELIEDESEPIEETIEPCVFKADYFINQNLSGFPYATREETAINYEWGNEAPEPLGNRYDLFSVRWVGDCYFEGGEYEFTAVFDDGIRAYFNNLEWIFNNWKDNGREVEMTHTRTIEEGYHNIKVEYYEYKHNAAIKFDWKKID